MATNRNMLCSETAYRPLLFKKYIEEYKSENVITQRKPLLSFWYITQYFSCTHM